jgi:hypothetical protein
MAEGRFDLRGMQAFDALEIAAGKIDQTTGEFLPASIATAHEITELELTLDVDDSRWQQTLTLSHDGGLGPVIDG